MNQEEIKKSPYYPEGQVNGRCQLMRTIDLKGEVGAVPDEAADEGGSEQVHGMLKQLLQAFRHQVDEGVYLQMSSLAHGARDGGVDEPNEEESGDFLRPYQ